ncbi:MAG TPA: hypothetical protein VMU84_19785 [Thermoanaerobaculia bacterium]|nr:hypothetical protein [Thermoanaerobaculia bacterium]
MTLFALMLAAATVGSLHSLAPDHWVPFAALARARNWSAMRTARLTLLCGFGHVTVSAILGIVALFVGLETVKVFGSTLESNAALLLVGFGIAYMVWGLWRSFRPKVMHQVDHANEVPHDHGHGHHHHHGSRMTEWSLFLLFCADPCVAVIPMIIAAAAAGWPAVLAVVLIYEVATITTMIVLVAGAHAGARTLKMAWLDRYGDAVAGALIIALGATLSVLGI